MLKRENEYIEEENSEGKEFTADRKKDSNSE
jgi:hypothetical protein